LRTLRETRRSYGLGIALGELAYRLARRLMNAEIAQVLQLDLAAMHPLKPPALDLVYRFLSAAEVRTTAADPASDLDAAMAERLKSGRDFCFGAFHGNRLASYSWYALDSIEPEHAFGAGLTFPLDTVYLYKAYTLPACRGQQIHGAALQQAARFFQRHGITQLIAIVEFANWASLRSHQKLGCRPAGRLLRIGRKSVGWGCGSLLCG
jgi:GNAT superfamily N-acetyltransferase